MVVQPSQTLFLTCAISGDSVSSNSATWDWVRQPPGEGLQWLRRIYFSSQWYRNYTPSLQSSVIHRPRHVQELVLPAAEVCDQRGDDCVLLCQGHSEEKSG